MTILAHQNPHGPKRQRPNEKIQPLPGDTTPKSHCGVKKDVPCFKESAEIIKWISRAVDNAPDAQSLFHASGQKIPTP